MKSQIESNGSEYTVIIGDKPIGSFATYGEAERVLFSRMKISGFSGMPMRGEPITGPVQVYEDKFPRDS